MSEGLSAWREILWALAALSRFTSRAEACINNEVIHGMITQMPQCPAPFRSASMRGIRLFGLSRLNDRASPNSLLIYSSVRATAFSRSLFFGINVLQAIDSTAGSYSHSPTRRPRSKIPWLGRSGSLPPLGPAKKGRCRSASSARLGRSRRK